MSFLRYLTVLIVAIDFTRHFTVDSALVLFPILQFIMVLLNDLMGGRVRELLKDFEKASTSPAFEEV